MGKADVNYVPPLRCEPSDQGGQSAGSPASDTVLEMPQTPEQFIRLLGGRWTLAILTGLANGGLRYQGVYEALDGISFKVLTETLRRAERDGLIARHLDPCRVETSTLYELTDLGRSLDAPLKALGEWATANWHSVETARVHWDQLGRASA
jgi:DNA-binding HxlR family transcriptional regulator